MRIEEGISDGAEDAIAKRARYKTNNKVQEKQEKD
jgi:hypothetical protein